MRMEDVKLLLHVMRSSPSCRAHNMPFLSRQKPSASLSQDYSITWLPAAAAQLIPFSRSVGMSYPSLRCSSTKVVSQPQSLVILFSPPFFL